MHSDVAAAASRAGPNSPSTAPNRDRRRFGNGDRRHSDFDAVSEIARALRTLGGDVDFADGNSVSVAVHETEAKGGDAQTRFR